MVSVYIAEMTPKETRGMLVATIGPTFNLGVTIALLANTGFAEFSSGWRVSIGMIAVTALVLAVGMCFMPHTPRYVWILLIYTVIYTFISGNYQMACEEGAASGSSLGPLENKPPFQHRNLCGYLYRTGGP